MANMTDLFASPWQATPEYGAYVTAQAEKTQRYRDHIAGNRVQHLVDRLVCTMVPQTPIGLSVLAIGCRNPHELNCLDTAGFSSVTGIDLVSMSPRILPMDMHQLTFPDASFDVVFASHSLEHAYDLDRALGEWQRVTRRGGWWAIEVPLGSPPTATDRHVLTLHGLVQRCQRAGPCRLAYAAQMRGTRLAITGLEVHALTLTTMTYKTPAGRVIVQCL